MKQTILFLRNGNLFVDEAKAIAGLRGLSTLQAGQPAVALYGTSGSVKLVFGIGTETGKCEIMATAANLESLVEELEELIGEVADNLSNHTNVAAGDSLGHVKTGGDLTFTEGEGSINANAVTLEKLQKAAAANVFLGSKTAGNDYSELSVAEVLEILGGSENIINKNNFSKVNVGEASIEASSMEDEFGFVGDGKNVNVSIEGKNVKISFDSSDLTAPEAEHAAEADKLSEAKNIKVTPADETYLTGGSASFDGSADAEISVSLDYDKLAADILANSALTGTPTAPTAAEGTNSTQVATTEFVKTAVDAAVAGGLADLASALVYRGTAASTDDLPEDAKVGDVYVASAAFNSSESATPWSAEPGDMIICNTNDGTSVDWVVIQANIDGAVTSLATSSVVNNLVSYNSTTGKVIKDSGIAADNVVLKDALKEVTASAGNDGVSVSGNSLEGITVSHKEKDNGTVNSGTGFTTSVEIDAYGHVISSTKSAVSVEQGEEVVTKGTKFISAIAPSEDGLGVVYTEQEIDFPVETGKVKVVSDGTADYLANKIVEGERTVENTYKVNVVQDQDKLKLDVTIDTIDGGTY